MIAALGAVVVIVHLLWGLGVVWALPHHLIESRGLAERLADVAAALFASAAIIGFLLLSSNRLHRTPPWVPVALAWVGSGATFTSGAYALALVLASRTGTDASTLPLGFVPVVDVIHVVVGIAIAATGVAHLSRSRLDLR
ncbi:hypothetical protein [Ruania halotolerans]|uniref:hypothetical protein n=1 Tax=Ruania halotolerans TaxID=2897773 RepID=UPI001E4069AC|nr:hypothetical protein [Ruania halotolerans]UFU05334.1 hypothetical protein LQF10_12825 [Ruania halotolerans]